MAGIEYRLTIRDAPMTGALKTLIRKTSDLRPFLKSVGEGEMNLIKDRFAGEHDPDGTPWQKLHPKTVARRAAKGYLPIKILRMRGNLAGSIAYRVESRRVRWGSPLVYAAIHQEGGMAGRGHAASIPPRPYLGFGDESWRMIEETAEDYLAL